LREDLKGPRPPRDERGGRLKPCGYLVVDEPLPVLEEPLPMLGEALGVLPELVLGELELELPLMPEVEVPEVPPDAPLELDLLK
jgi:hypothetical protein